MSSLQPLRSRQFFLDFHSTGFALHHLFRQVDDARRCGFRTYARA
jgi:hypothetical protein